MLLYRISALAAVAYFAAAGAAADSRTCYFPNGNASTGGACNPNAEVSACCGPKFVCLSNGLCKPGPNVKKTYDYEFYRSACTDSTFNSTACPRFCLDPAYGSRGTGVKSCGNNQYCCGASGDCCTDAASLFRLGDAEVVTTISPSSSFVTDTANSTSGESQSSGRSHHALAIGLGVGIGIGGFLLLVLGVLYMLKRRARAKSHLGYEKKEEPSEMDGSSNAELPDSSPEPPPTKTHYTVPGSGVVYEIGDGNAGPSTQPVELEAKPRYDWEPRNEPEPRDGGFRPMDHDRHGA